MLTGNIFSNEGGTNNFCKLLGGGQRWLVESTITWAQGLYPHMWSSLANTDNYLRLEEAWNFGYKFINIGYYKRWPNDRSKHLFLI